MAGIATATYGCIAYTVFLLTFLYAIGFTGGFPVPKPIDGGVPLPLMAAMPVNMALLAVFAVQHSLMARPIFKRWWTRLVPAPVERSTYVLFASSSLILLFWQWRPMPALIWSVEHPVGSAMLLATFWAGWLLVLTSTFLINHFELFGLRQVFARLRNRPIPEAGFTTPFLYRLVRHPIYLGFIMAFWAAPQMSVGHLLFAVGTTGYILVGIQLEERDLIGLFGDTYRRYRREVRMLLPLPRRRMPVETAGALASQGA